MAAAPVPVPTVAMVARAAMAAAAAPVAAVRDWSLVAENLAPKVMTDRRVIAVPGAEATVVPGLATRQWQLVVLAFSRRLLKATAVIPDQVETGVPVQTAMMGQMVRMAGMAAMREAPESTR